jgi:hypothetical protein
MEPWTSWLPSGGLNRENLTEVINEKGNKYKTPNKGWEGPRQPTTAGSTATGQRPKTSKLKPIKRQRREWALKRGDLKKKPQRRGASEAREPGEGARCQSANDRKAGAGSEPREARVGLPCAERRGIPREETREGFATLRVEGSLNDQGGREIDRSSWRAGTSTFSSSRP